VSPNRTPSQRSSTKKSPLTFIKRFQKRESVDFSLTPAMKFQSEDTSSDKYCQHPDWEKNKLLLPNSSSVPLACLSKTLGFFYFLEMGCPRVKHWAERANQ
jgi:hypothetical protein